MELTWNGKALLATLLFRLLFGGYIVAMDQYSFNDPESAVTVAVTYALIAALAVLFLFGQKIGIMGLLGFEAVYFVINLVFLVMSLGQVIDPGMHSPTDNVWTTILRFVFSGLTLVLSFKTYKETKRMLKPKNESHSVRKIRST